MLLKVALAVVLVLVVVVVAVALYAASRPAEFRITRSALIGAPPAVVFPLVNHLRAWDAWSPWDKRDPNLTRTYSGPEAGEGAHYAWAGNKDVGVGQMTIVESVPSERIAILLEFTAPMKATNDTVFGFTPEGAGTRIEWSMSGCNGFAGKLFTIFMDMDAMVGKDFEQGLKSPDAAARAKAS